jgi:hypothetical protein
MCETVLLYFIFCWADVCSFLHVKKFRNKEKKKKWCFVKRRIKKTILEHPFFFPLPPSLPMTFFFSTTISSRSNFNNQVILEGQTTISMWRWVMFLVGCCHIHCWFCWSNFIVKYVKLSIISKVLAKVVKTRLKKRSAT